MKHSQEERPVAVALGRRIPLARTLALAGAAGLALALGGCGLDSFLDPSTVQGRWEPTPTEVPVLDRIAAIEDQDGEFVEYSDVQPEDLLPASRSYRVGPGDQLMLDIFDLVVRGQSQVFQRLVDTRGFIDLPQLGQIYVAGKTIEGVRQAIADAMKFLIPDPVIDVQVVSQRSQLFHLLGAIERPGPYFIPTPDYRLLEALGSGGRFSESIDDVYIIRQIPLSEALQVPGQEPQQPVVDPNAQPARPPIDLIDDLTRPGQGSFGSFPRAEAQRTSQPATRDPIIDLPDSPGTPPARTTAATTSTPPPPGPRPVVDLPDTAAPTGARAPSEDRAAPTGETTWVFLNGKWVQVLGGRGVGAAGAGATAPPGMKADEILTQRVIRVPLKRLLAGDMQYNIVVRPGDTIRLPQAAEGQIYMAGQIVRPGTYNLPFNGKLTLYRAIVAAGGFGQIADASRVDLTRRVGPNREATIMLDARAIANKTQPDIVLKPDDIINVGTNFWMTPLAVIRNGFRASYGFGFILDRNFGNDVFGAPPTNRFGQ